MRIEDLKVLEQPYAGTATEHSQCFRERLGVYCPEVSELAAAILADFDTKLFGVGWWAASPLGTKRRIFISDALYQSVSSIDDNLVEARLHLMELQQWYDEENRQNANAVSLDPRSGQPHVRLAPPKSAREQLASTMSTLHVVGVLRSVNTVLDCLGAAIVGVGALPLAIQRVTYGSILNFFGKPATLSEPHAELARAVSQRVTDAGPPGWLDWTRQSRHTSLHRGRRLNSKQLTPRHPVLISPEGVPIPRVDTTSLLPAEPELSEVQALQVGRSQQLTEPALVTLVGSLNSTLSMVRGICHDLIGLWAKRGK